MKNLYFLSIIVFVYITIASIVFSVKHPWATDMEKLVHINKVLTFGTVNYNEMRPR
jgi:hypothetical protein